MTGQQSLNVLIESDWNLKFTAISVCFRRLTVLIESDWNLKVDTSIDPKSTNSCINRIRLEFKEEALFS